MNHSSSLVRSKPLWSSTAAGRCVLGWHIPEEIFAVFFILVILALAKDENVVSKVQNNISIQIAVAILVLYCIYNKIPWSLAFILAFVIVASFTDFFVDAKGTVGKIWKTITEKFKERKDQNNKKNPDLMRVGARVLGLMNQPKGILKKSDPTDKKVSFEDEESDSDSDDDICDEVSQVFGFGDDTDTEADTTDNETEEDQQKRKGDLIDFLNNESK